MQDILLTKGTWVLVCDGARASMLRNDGDTEKPRLTSVEVFSEPHAAARDLGSDRPGRVHASTGQARSATEETDWHEQAEADFLKKIAAELNSGVQVHRIVRLVVVAPPRAMGILRELLSADVAKLVVAEVTKDLSKHAPDDIAAHLAD
jgi:protein required for attachment to host cells